MGSVLIAAALSAGESQAQTTTRARSSGAVASESAPSAQPRASATSERRDSSRPESASRAQPESASRTRAARSEPTRAQPAPPCLGPTVELRRANGGFVWRGPLVDCHGRVRPEALAGIAAIASPQSGAQSFSPDLSSLTAQIRRVAPVAGWEIAQPPVERPARARARRSRAANSVVAAVVCPRGQELVEPSSSAAESSAEPARREARASVGARQLRGQQRQGARSEARCRAIEVNRDAHTRDAVVEVDRRVRVLHPRLLEMLARVAERWPGRAIEVVSGYRPSNDPHAGSRHAHARALDFRVVGVSRESLRDFCRTLPLAGVGYYPHSVFVHLDVRDRAEGSARWTDYSEPGERPRYGHWPPNADDVVREMHHITQRVDALLEAAARTEQ